ncbi:MAG: Asp-tRNA(Asn)/Glu-tRNA(Gln) amidotransferase GatCAB subunit C [Candidatus Omnitrophica bacterium CG07_land_8_20_14_0_80_42_15]|uniref:Aspartyl/glutamyl-tRNA(Asn/Gln) amidotransferase subunit C n=1 Tax=Candidatus Aquitaenariimonas noxiae TaxID=1974741 RepID=A0A2J0KU42_9BACT|nr:MAG: Asp-tRNA(Asn)/Glu-tRNA(Gln) amidotransferase GatCAB subunit C [Candidatus Omnitrophica bacterium CG07_land_8_20_14_0_80_42_15]
MGAIKKEDIEYVAYLSRLKIPPEQIGRFTSRLSNILSYIDKLKNVDIKDTLPTSHPLSLKNVFRKDEVRKSLNAADALKIAPEVKDAFFKVPKVIE